MARCGTRLLAQRRQFVAETHVSTQSAPSPQDARLPRAHEVRRWTQGPGGSPQEGTSSPHANLGPRPADPLFRCEDFPGPCASDAAARDRKSTRLNSSHGYISYAVFCLKKKKKKQ